MSVEVFEGEIDEVSPGIDGDGVSVGHLERAEQGERAVAVLEDGDGAGFGGDVEALENRIEDEYIGIVADGVGMAEDAHGLKIDQCQRVIAFASDKSDAVLQVERDAVGVVDAGQMVTRGDGVFCGVDHDKLVEPVDGDEDAAGGGIVDGVARAAAERDVGDERVGCAINDRIYAAVFIGDEDLVLKWRVGDAVGVGDGSSLADDLERVCVDGDELVVAGGRGVDAVCAGDGEDAVNAAKAAEIGEYRAGGEVEDDEVIIVHVGDVEATVGGVEALVIEADGGSGQRDVGDGGQNGPRGGCLRDADACGEEDSESGAERGWET
uniref:Uncharacterized protein n=1 Tax=mine drainage metagenome TaxID=410659 RepID=E6PY30_9ZZZZ